MKNITLLIIAAALGATELVFASDEAHGPFTPWNEGPDAIPFEALPASEQEAVVEQAKRADLDAGDEVAQRWSSCAHDMAARARVEAAGRLAGLSGTAYFGVAP